LITYRNLMNESMEFKSPQYQTKGYTSGSYLLRCLSWL
jgi:hypothetical protein